MGNTNSNESKKTTVLQSVYAPFDQLPYRVKDGFLDALTCADCERIVFDYESFKPFKDWLEGKKRVHPSVRAMPVDKILPFFQTTILQPHKKDFRSRSYVAQIGQGDLPIHSTPPMINASISHAALQRMPKGKAYIERNKEGKRLDGHLGVPDQLLNSVKHRRPKLCNNFHLLGTCVYGDGCQYAHGFLSPDDKVILREVAREQPCRYGSFCADVACYAGHRCLRRGRCGETCRFPREMHFNDVQPASLA